MKWKYALPRERDTMTGYRSGPIRLTAREYPVTDITFEISVVGGENDLRVFKVLTIRSEILGVHWRKDIDERTRATTVVGSYINDPDPILVDLGVAEWPPIEREEFKENLAALLIASQPHIYRAELAADPVRAAEICANSPSESARQLATKALGDAVGVDAHKDFGVLELANHMYAARVSHRGVPGPGILFAEGILRAAAKRPYRKLMGEV